MTIEENYKMPIFKKNIIFKKEFKKNKIPPKELLTPVPFTLNSITKLKIGENEISFRVNNFEICKCKLFIWNRKDKIIITDFGIIILNNRWYNYKIKYKRNDIINIKNRLYKMNYQKLFQN
jgi:hypothetical protein